MAAKQEADKRLCNQDTVVRPSLRECFCPQAVRLTHSIQQQKRSRRVSKTILPGTIKFIPAGKCPSRFKLSCFFCRKGRGGGVRPQPKSMNISRASGIYPTSYTSTAYTRSSSSRLRITTLAGKSPIKVNDQYHVVSTKSNPPATKNAFQPLKYSGEIRSCTTLRLPKSLPGRS